MKSVGEAMAIGRTFCEALQKAARSLETGRDGLAEPVRPGRLPALAPTRTADAINVMEAPREPAPRSQLPPGWTGSALRRHAARGSP
jgi:hypothetical protein